MFVVIRTNNEKKVVRATHEKKQPRKHFISVFVESENAYVFVCTYTRTYYYSRSPDHKMVCLTPCIHLISKTCVSSIIFFSMLYPSCVWVCERDRMSSFDLNAFFPMHFLFYIISDRNSFFLVAAFSHILSVLLVHCLFHQKKHRWQGKKLFQLMRRQTEKKQNRSENWLQSSKANKKNYFI